MVVLSLVVPIPLGIGLVSTNGHFAAAALRMFSGGNQQAAVASAIAEAASRKACESLTRSYEIYYTKLLRFIENKCCQFFARFN
jgi:hypothetical protein